MWQALWLKRDLMQRIALLFALPFLCLLLAQPPATFASPATKAKAAHTSTPSDAQLEATIRAKLAKSKIGKDGFKFHVQHGVVTWEGTTNVIQHKGAATRMARTAGAAQVINNIQISAAAKAKATANLKKASIVQ
jgi:CubicO group peptidase (beta-lactamase class C family)